MDKFLDQVSLEAIYQIMRAQFAARRLLLTRREFLERKYMVIVTCDGLLALANKGLPLQLVVQTPPPSNGQAGSLAGR